MADKFLNLTGLARFLDKIKEYIDSRLPQIETQGNWRYRINPGGTYEAWFGATGQTYAITYASGTLYRSELLTLTLPTGITSKGTPTIDSFNVGAGHNNYPVWASVASKSSTTLRYYVLSGGSRASNSNYTLTAHVFGRLQ